MAELDEVLDAQDVAARLRARLPARSFDVLYLRFGLGLTFAEIGKRLGVCKQRAHQLMRQAVAMAMGSLRNS